MSSMDIKNPAKYSMLVEDIKKKIKEKDFLAGEKLPSENELMDLYNLSRTTVIRGLEILANENYINTVPRVGSFVSNLRLTTASVTIKRGHFLALVKELSITMITTTLKKKIFLIVNILRFYKDIIHYIR